MIYSIKESLVIHISLQHNCFSRCDCAMFADVQFRPSEDIQTPLAFEVSTDLLDPNTCLLPEGPDHPCAQFCNDYAYHDTSDGLGLCFETPNDVSYIVFCL